MVTSGLIKVKQNMWWRIAVLFSFLKKLNM